MSITKSFYKRPFGASAFKGICRVRKIFSTFHTHLALFVLVIMHNCISTGFINNIKPEVALNYFVFPNLIIKLSLLQLPNLNRIFSPCLAKEAGTNHEILLTLNAVASSCIIDRSIIVKMIFNPFLIFTTGFSFLLLSLQAICECIS